MADFIRKKGIIAWVFCLIIGALGCHSTEEQTDVDIVPRPLSIEKGAGHFVFKPETVISIPGNEYQKVAETFVSLFTHSAGFTPQIRVGQEGGDICLVVDNSLKEEAYEMKIQPRKIILKAAGGQGFFLCISKFAFNATFFY